MKSIKTEELVNILHEIAKIASKGHSDNKNNINRKYIEYSNDFSAYLQITIELKAAGPGNSDPITSQNICKYLDSIEA